MRNPLEPRSYLDFRAHPPFNLFFTVYPHSLNATLGRKKQFSEYDWLIDVLADVQSFAQQNDLFETSEMLSYTRFLAFERSRRSQIACLLLGGMSLS